jgi:CheY-like chemotaxis protein
MTFALKSCLKGVDEISDRAGAGEAPPWAGDGRRFPGFGGFQAHSRSKHPVRRTQRIVVAADSSSLHDQLKAGLAPAELDLVTVRDGAATLAWAQEQPPDLLLLAADLPWLEAPDPTPPERGGFALCRRLKDTPATRDVPVIFVGEAEDPATKVRAFDLGAVDYIVNPFDPAELRARVCIGASHQVAAARAYRAGPARWAQRAAQPPLLRASTARGAAHRPAASPLARAGADGAGQVQAGERRAGPFTRRRV